MTADGRADLSLARQIARLICPERDTAPPSTVDSDSPAEAGVLLATLQRNKVPLLSLDIRAAQPHAAAFLASEPFQSALADQSDRWKAWCEAYRAVHKAFARAGIRDVIIKSVGIVPSLPYMSDNLDTLVYRKDGPRARQVLVGLGYQELRNVEEPHKFLFRKFHLGRSVAAVHLHEFVGWGTGFMDDAGVLSRAHLAADDPTVVIPSPGDGLLINMAHASYEDKEIRLGDLWKVIHVLQRHDLGWEGLYAQVSRRGWREGLDTCIWLWAELELMLWGMHSFPEEILQGARRGAPSFARDYVRMRLAQEPRFPWPISFAFSKRLYYGKVWRDETLSRREKRIDALCHTWAGLARRLPFTTQRPMLVSLSGIDGAGKSAHAELLRQAFNECGIDIRIVWSRGGSSRLTDRVIGLVKRFLPGRDLPDAGSDSSQAKVARKGAWLQRSLVRSGWGWLVTLDLLWQYWLRVAWPLLWGRVVIADRYAYDALVETAALARRPELVRSLPARALLALCPHPQKAYLLRVSVAEAMRRKPEEMPGFLQEQDRLFHRMSRGWGLRVMSGQSDLAQISDRVVGEVLTAYYSRWGPHRSRSA